MFYIVLMKMIVLMEIIVIKQEAGRIGIVFRKKGTDKIAVIILNVLLDIVTMTVWAYPMILFVLLPIILTLMEMK